MVKGINQPQQDRSRRSTDRLVSASIDMMADGSFDEVPITEIIRKADCSVGAFYGRFEGKDALFHLVQERVLEEARQWLEGAFRRFLSSFKAAKPVPAAKAARFVIHTLYRLYTRKTGAYRAVFLHTRIRRDEALTRRVEAFNAFAIEQATALFSRVEYVAEDEASVDRWLLGLEILSAYLRERILFGPIIPLGKDESIGGSSLKQIEDFYLSYAAHPNAGVATDEVPK